MARTRLNRDGSLVEEDSPVRDISRHLADPSTTVWLELYRPDRAEFTAVGEELGLHELALEDALYEGQRAKLDKRCDCPPSHFVVRRAVHDRPPGQPIIGRRPATRRRTTQMCRSGCPERQSSLKTSRARRTPVSGPVSSSSQERCGPLRSGPGSAL